MPLCNMTVYEMPIYRWRNIVSLMGKNISSLRQMTLALFKVPLRLDVADDPKYN